jgi:ribulose-phosphate 3-epimerase
VTVRIAHPVLSADLGRLKEQLAEIEAGRRGMDPRGCHGRSLRPQPDVRRAADQGLKKLSTPSAGRASDGDGAGELPGRLCRRGRRVFTFHPEATVHVQRQLARVGKRHEGGASRSIPRRRSALIEEVVDDLDLVLVMSVNPGFGGQRYIEAATGKIRRMRDCSTRAAAGRRSEVDGGITAATIRRAWQAGRTPSWRAPAVFGETDPAAAVQRLKQACTTAV